MKTIFLYLCSIGLLLMTAMTTMAQSARLDSLQQVKENINSKLNLLQPKYDSIYHILAQCKTDEERLVQHAELKKLDKKADKLSQHFRKVEKEITVEEARIEQVKREAYLAQKQAEIEGIYPFPLKGERNGHPWVDLGLPSGTKWATYNVGTKRITGVGTRIAWGETATKKLFSPNTYKLNDTSLIDYTGNPIYDLATAQWGEGWCTPTLQQWNELIKYCDWNYVMIDGIYGVLFTSRKTYNTIFMPSTGYTDDDTYKLIYTTYNLAYWASTEGQHGGAHAYIANYEGGYMTTTNKYIAHCVRAVCSTSNTLTTENQVADNQTVNNQTVNNQNSSTNTNQPINESIQQASADTIQPTNESAQQPTKTNKQNAASIQKAVKTINQTNKAIQQTAKTVNTLRKIFRR